MTGGNELLETVLRQCAAQEPLYAGPFAETSGVPRDRLDAAFDQLRLGGLVRLTDWVTGRGQGYALTDEGRALLNDARRLERLKRHGVPPKPVAPTPAEPDRVATVTSWDRGEAIRNALFMPTSRKVTFMLLAVNFLWFFAGTVLSQFRNVPPNEFLGGSGRITPVVHELGGMTTGDVYRHHQWWRLITSCFVHFGAIHLMVNMVSLMLMGPILETLLGKAWFLTAYLICGWGGGCAVLIFTDFRIVAAGASGALWGLMALEAIWIVRYRRHLPQPHRTQMIRNLIFCIIMNVMITHLVPNISAAAHYGGGVTGLLLALPLEMVRFGRGGLRVAGAALVLLVPVAAVVVALAVQRPLESALADLLQTHSQAEKTYDTHVLSHKADYSAFVKDAQAIAAAQEAIRQTQRRIESCRESLRVACASAAENDLRSFQAADDYLSLWRDLFVRFEESIDRQTGYWPTHVERRRTELERLARMIGIKKS